MRPNGLTRRGWLVASAAASSTAALGQGTSPSSTYIEILRPPDHVTAFVESEPLALSRDGKRWTARGIVVEAEPRKDDLPVRIASESEPLMRVHLRWTAKVPERWRIVNDQWERSYGDLEWRGMLGERVLPWYFLAFDGNATHGYGVETGPACFAFWQVDPEGISLWLDVRNGGGPVRLGKRTLAAVTVKTQRGSRGQSAFAAAQAFCRALCPHPILPREPVYGGNNWYYAYGQNCSAAGIERDSDLVAVWSGGARNRPFMVIDDGWTPTNTAGPWDHGNERLPDMAALASAMKKRGVRPGIWMRPLYTTASIPVSAQLRPNAGGSSEGKVTLDPTVPEMMELVRQDIRRLAEWGYELIKHDFSSYDLLGRWGFSMGAEMTRDGWHFADQSKTTAEVVLDLYKNIREAAGQTLVIGCNTFGHLAAGLVEIQRTGDDTSGREFHRTRRMGVNTLAFRAPQHRTFFDLDADCAPITPQLPWSLASQWLDLVAGSGTALFVSADPRSLNAETTSAIRKAFSAAAQPRPVAEPLDWMETTTPSNWHIDGKDVHYDWYGPEGGTPFPR